MRITRFQLHNFKSVRDLPALGFGAGFNIIVGPINAGKTALLTALSLSFGNEPHRSPETVPGLLVDRRAFLGIVAGSLLAAPLVAEAQQAGKVYRIGLLDYSAPDPARQAW